MPQENRPLLPENQFSAMSRGRRNFGSMVQLLSSIGEQSVTATNWTSVCQNLREKITLLGVETDMKSELLREEREARQHDRKWHIDLASNFKRTAAENNRLKDRIKRLEDELLALKEDHNRTRTNLWYREWRCSQLWNDLLEADPTKSGFMPSLYEDSCEGPPPPYSDNVTPKRKRRREDPD